MFTGVLLVTSLILINPACAPAPQSYVLKILKYYPCICALVSQVEELSQCGTFKVFIHVFLHFE